MVSPAQARGEHPRSMSEAARAFTRVVWRCEERTKAEHHRIDHGTPYLVEGQWLYPRWGDGAEALCRRALAAKNSPPTQPAAKSTPTAHNNAPTAPPARHERVVTKTSPVPHPAPAATRPAREASAAPTPLVPQGLAAPAHTLAELLQPNQAVQEQQTKQCAALPTQSAQDACVHRWQQWYAMVGGANTYMAEHAQDGRVTTGGSLARATLDRENLGYFAGKLAELSVQLRIPPPEVQPQTARQQTYQHHAAHWHHLRRHHRHYGYS